MKLLVNGMEVSASLPLDSRFDGPLSTMWRGDGDGEKMYG